MTFVATWTILMGHGPTAGGEMTVRTRQDIAALLQALAEPGATAAMLRHEARPMVPDGRGGQVPDHDMTVGVWRGYGYLSFIDADHDSMTLAGLPDSPDYPAHYVEYDQGEGIPLEQLQAALTEFLETGRRPAGVTWHTPR